VASSSPCECGRTLPTLGRVEGRTISLFHTADGRLISPWRLIQHLNDCAALAQFQIVQKDLDYYHVRYVADRPLSTKLTASLCDSFCEMLAHNVTVTFERVAEISRTRTGKILSAICEWTPHVRQAQSDIPMGAVSSGS
jgi:phenylacetate-CoA ligase